MGKRSGDQSPWNRHVQKCSPPAFISFTLGTVPGSVPGLQTSLCAGVCFTLWIRNDIYSLYVPIDDYLSYTPMRPP